MGDYSDRLRKSEWEVRAVALSTAQDITRRHHYARGGSNTAVATHGLFRIGDFWEYDCRGIAWWLPPTKSAALATYPENWNGVLSLTRLVIVPDVPKNACSFLLAGAMKLLDRKRWPCLVTYADPWQGHEGTIYKATNWQYVGQSKPERIYMLNGVLKSRKYGPRSRNHSEMLALGCEVMGKTAKHKFTHVINGSGAP